MAKCGHQQILREESPDKQQNWKEPRFLEALPCIQLFGYVVWPITSDQLQVCGAGDGNRTRTSTLVRVNTLAITPHQYRRRIMTSNVMTRELRPDEMCKDYRCRKERSPRTNPRTSQCHQLQQSNLNMSYQLETLQLLTYHKSKRDSVINQVPITTNPSLPKYYIDS